MIVKGKTKSGYNYQVDSRIKDDRRFVKLIVAMQSGEAMEQLKALDQLEMLILGSEENIKKLEEIIESKNDGFCPTDVYFAEIQEIIEALNAKNS